MWLLCGSMVVFVYCGCGCLVIFVYCGCATNTSTTILVCINTSTLTTSVVSVWWCSGVCVLCGGVVVFVYCGYFVVVRWYLCTVDVVSV